MNKQNLLFAIVGILAGLIVGFMFANSLNRNMATPVTASASTMNQNSNMPAGHPEVPGSNTSPQPSMANASEIEAAIDKARKEPNNFEAQISAAQFYYQIERYDGALEFLIQANKLKPDNYEIIVQLGNASFDANKFEEAEKWYLSALNKKAEDTNVRTDLGLTFVLRNPPNYERAIQEFNRSLTADPKHVKSMQNLVVAYLKKGDLPNAKATLAKLENLEPSNVAIPRLREELKKVGG